MPRVSNTAVNYAIVLVGAGLYAWAHKFQLPWSDPLTYVAAIQWITSIRGTAAFAHDMSAAPDSVHSTVELKEVPRP
jgi:hypothetical protein